jgi:predicted permease
MSLTGIERLTQSFVRNISAFFALLMSVTGLLLLIACANVASLLLARSSARAQEFAIRMSIGAGRGRLVRKLIAESLLLSVLGTTAGLVLNYAMTRVLNGLDLPLPFPLQLSIEPDGRLIAYAVCTAFGAALIVGLLPAFRSTRSGPGALLKQEEHQVSGRRANLRNALVSGQIAVSVVVLILAALSIRNLLAAASLDPGFDLNQTVWAQMRLVPENYGSPEKVRAMASLTVERLQELPGMEAATVASFVPLNDHFLSRRPTVFTDHLPEGKRIEHWWNAIGPDYLRTMGIGMVAGREFTPADREGSARVIIVNEAFVREAFGTTNPIGQRQQQVLDNR